MRGLLSPYALVLLALLSACAPVTPPVDELSLSPARFDDLPGWKNDTHAEALTAFKRSCAVFLKRGSGPAIGEVAAWLPACKAANTVPSNDDAARRYFETWFAPFRAGNRGEAEGLFTGYYEIALRGSRTKTPRYSTPLYKRPPDLVTVELGDFREKLAGERIAGRVKNGKLTPFEDRAKIEDGALAGKGLEIAWVDDPVDAFLLHVQGSGRVKMEDGSTLRLNYDGQNGHPYVSIGKILINEGEIPREQMSTPALRAWLESHPQRVREILDTNPSYVFFRESTGDGPLGAQGVAVTPGRSLAVDKKFIPLGVPLWLDTTLPSSEPYRRLMIAQDTGGAIRGPVRGDIFFGYGEAAGATAGLMKNPGEYYLLLPKASK
ncbi:MAG: murein transglycosylase A [Alphaproteobacteria bacterium]|nr:murein transglycosylase A [Alphaproteobacteria bacterium]